MLATAWISRPAPVVARGTSSRIQVSVKHRNRKVSLSRSVREGMWKTKRRLELNADGSTGGSKTLRLNAARNIRGANRTLKHNDVTVHGEFAFSLSYFRLDGLKLGGRQVEVVLREYRQLVQVGLRISDRLLQRDDVVSSGLLLPDESRLILAAPFPGMTTGDYALRWGLELGRGTGQGGQDMLTRWLHPGERLVLPAAGHEEVEIEFKSSH